MKSSIDVKGARVHNLKNIDVSLPRHQLVVITGLSGSGKSSLAFDTIYAEGQRRYMASLSAYARQFLDQLDKPDVDVIEGLSPAISIDQKNASQNPRSTVGTITEIYDYLRLLYASIGTPYCPNCNTPIEGMSPQEIVDTLLTWPQDDPIMIISPICEEQKGSHEDTFKDLIKQGYSRVRVNNEMKRLSEPIKLNKNKKHRIELVVDRLNIDPSDPSRLFQSIESALGMGKGRVLIENKDQQQLFSESLSCPTCQVSIPEISPRLFSFNSPIGACESCNGLGTIMDFDPNLVIKEPDKPLYLSTGKIMSLDNTYYGRYMAKLGQEYGFDLNTPFSQMTDTQKNIVLYGQENPAISSITAVRKDKKPRNRRRFEGIISNLRRRYIQTHSEGMRFFFRSYMSKSTCQECQGKRLKKQALSILINQTSITQITQLSIQECLAFFKTLTLTKSQAKIAHQILKEINGRLSFLQNVGLTYLSLDRQSGTLSGGEYQRIRLATQVGAGLTGVLYVLDEPSIGLHQRDNERLIQTLKNLRDLGNTLIVVEHDEDTILSADYVIDIGPKAGRHGGNVCFQGPLKEFKKKAQTLTADYINKTKSIPVPKKRRPINPKKHIRIHKAQQHNLKNITATIPLNTLTCITGVSGSGKSTLIDDILKKALMRHFHQSHPKPGQHEKLSGLENIDSMIIIDQSAIGRTPRSNPATYSGVFSPIRDLFVKTPEAKIRGYKPGRFSFNVKGGRCEACEGDGVKKIEMHFLSDVFVTCDTCKGSRYNTETRQVKYKGYSIADVLGMTINEASELFKNIPTIHKKLQTLVDVGLGYIHLGQNATTLSGGEAQRVKLAKELSKRNTGNTLYLLDEPTTGLHFYDVEQLLIVLHRLVDQGNTVVVIEHHLDVIKTADHLIDLGPEGGKGGGEIVGEGTPEEIAKIPNSYTGQHLQSLLKKVKCNA